MGRVGGSFHALRLRIKNKFKNKLTDKAIAAAVEKKAKAKIKALAESKTKEGEAEAFIVLCLKKYATGKSLPPKAVSTFTIAPVQAQADPTSGKEPKPMTTVTNPNEEGKTTRSNSSRSGCC
jgi:hypothetical protein